MNKNSHIIFILLILIFSCKNRNIDTSIELKKALIFSKKSDLNNILIKYNIISPYNIKIKDSNYFYLFARLFYKKIGHNKLSDYLLTKAITKNNLFINEALQLYVQSLIQNESWNNLKKVINNNQDHFIINTDQQLLFIYANNKTLNHINNMPSDKHFFPLIYEIIKNNSTALQQIENQTKIHDFFIKSEIYNDFDAKFIDKLKDIIELSKDDFFLSSIYHFIINDKTSFKNSMEIVLNKNISDDKIKILKKLSIKLNLRKSFYMSLAKNYNNDKLKMYYYGLEVIHFENNKKGIKILKEALPYFDGNNMINYKIRYNLLYNNRKLTSEWVKNVVEFINDYPDSYKSKSLLDILFRMAIIQNKKSFIIPFLENLSTKSMNCLEESMYLYKLYLIDKKNKDKYQKIIIKKYPLSYAGLIINKGNISIPEEQQTLQLADKKKCLKTL